MNYTRTSDTNKPIVNISATIEEINQHTEQVLRGENSCPVSICPKCGAKSNNFKHREAKPRIFYVLIEQVIQIVNAFLTLWKCPECKKCFMGYPPFAVPYKRYTTATICEFSRRYVENDAMSYRGVINETPLLSETKPEWELSHTTIHRWITTLGRLDTTLAKAQDLIMQANPLSTISRDLAAVGIACRKYTSDARKSLLLTCRKILKTGTWFCQPAVQCLDFLPLGMLYINQFSGCVMKLTDESDIWIELKLGFLWYLPLIMKSLLDIHQTGD